MENYPLCLWETPSAGRIFGRLRKDVSVGLGWFNHPAYAGCLELHRILETFFAAHADYQMIFFDERTGFKLEEIDAINNPKDYLAKECIFSSFLIFSQNCSDVILYFFPEMFGVLGLDKDRLSHYGIDTTSLKKLRSEIGDYLVDLSIPEIFESPPLVNWTCA